MSYWGKEVIVSDDYEPGRDPVWISRQAVPDEQEAIELVAVEVGDPDMQFQATAVLMREESEVEARILFHEWPCMVECTPRARKPEPFWRVERVEL